MTKFVEVCITTHTTVLVEVSEDNNFLDAIAKAESSVEGDIRETEIIEIHEFEPVNRRFDYIVYLNDKEEVQ